MRLWVLERVILCSTVLAVQACASDLQLNGLGDEEDSSVENSDVQTQDGNLEEPETAVVDDSSKAEDIAETPALDTASVPDTAVKETASFDAADTATSPDTHPPPADTAHETESSGTCIPSGSPCACSASSCFYDGAGRVVPNTCCSGVCRNVLFPLGPKMQCD